MLTPCKNGVFVSIPFARYQFTKYVLRIPGPFVSRGCAVTSTIMDKNRQVSPLKQEAICAHLTGAFPVQRIPFAHESLCSSAPKNIASRV